MFIDSIVAFTKHPIVERAYKTFVEVSAAQAAAYGTVVPNSPGVRTSAVVSAGATVLSVLWNALLAHASKRQAAKLTALADAIDRAVAVRLAVQAEAQKAAPTTP